MLQVNINCNINSLTQESYDEAINLINGETIQCPICHHYGMKDHGYYERDILQAQNINLRLKVKRLKCNNCGRTHALLPLDVVPYKIITTFLALKILELKITDKDRLDKELLEKKHQAIEDFLIEYESLSELYIYRIQKEFYLHWKKRIMPKEAYQLSTESFKEIINKFCIAFMQIKLTKCFLNAYFP